jgi:hypothetical protein
VDIFDRWPSELGLGEYAEAFAAQGIDFELLAELTSERA